MNAMKQYICEEIETKTLDQVYERFVTHNNPSDREMRFYEAIGVPIFKKALMATIGRGRIYCTEPSNYRMGIPTTENAMRFAIETVKNESTHAPPTLGAGLASIACLAAGSLSLAGVFAGLTLMNGYPTMLQRYNRGRIARVLDRSS